MKKYLLASVSTLALNCGAIAADLPVKAPPAPMVAPANWTGWYIGVQGGVVGHRGTFDDIDGYLQGANGFGGQQYVTTPLGGIAGGHVGYNWQVGRVVLGAEADISGVWADITQLSPPPATSAFNSSLSFDTRWLATVRARAGVTITDDTLFYLTGGVAFSEVHDNATLDVGNPSHGTIDINTIKTGWTGGGGIEHRFGPRWTVRVEGRYVDLGKSTIICPDASCSTGPYRGEFSNTLLMGLVGASLKF